ncbi:hypothetical protein CBL_08222 [Carabus blaptoides fortunei]
MVSGIMDRKPSSNILATAETRCHAKHVPQFSRRIFHVATLLSQAEVSGFDPRESSIEGPPTCILHYHSRCALCVSRGIVSPTIPLVSGGTPNTTPRIDVPISSIVSTELTIGGFVINFVIEYGTYAIRISHVDELSRSIMEKRTILQITEEGFIKY